jgi:L-iduronidase
MEPTVHCDRSVGTIEHFWRSTGFTPAALLLREDMRQALTYAGSVPRAGIRYVRVHYLLDLVEATGLVSGEPVLTWNTLDRGLDVLVANGLVPFFELMGNPSRSFSDFEDETQLRALRRLVRDLAVHLVGRYGREHVVTWYFETWNEPDLGWWPQWPANERSFCSYYDAVEAGLHDANPALLLGGPGTARTLSSLFRSFMEHVDTGVNRFSGRCGTRIDFISVHEKGCCACPEDLDPDTEGLVSAELEAVEYLRCHHPRLAKLPFINDECDPIVGWQDIHTWRATSYYASQVVRSVHRHLVRMIDGARVDYRLLSNDNGFLGTWGNRTLCARLGDEQQLEAGRFALVKKPVHNVMTMLSLLGDERCRISGDEDLSGAVGAIATVARDHAAVVVYHGVDRIRSSGRTDVRLRFTGIPFEASILATYRIDEDHGNPFRVWEKGCRHPHGLRPPTPSILAELRRSHELVLDGEPRPVVRRDADVTLSLPLHSACLVLVCARPADPPQRVTGLRFDRSPGLWNQGETMLAWRALASRAVRTYEVLRSDRSDGMFSRINEADLIDAAYLDSGRGWYKVRAVDYWGRAGEESEVLEV